jgi:cytochrome c oxidase cbb3-type subunit I/II
LIDTLAKEQAKDIAKELRVQGRFVDPDREVVALIAYLQCLGKTWEPSVAPVAPPK